MKRPIHAISLAPDAKGWLTTTLLPRFLHIFDHACNLINERGEVLSIVAPQIGNGPFNLVIEDCFCFTEHLNPQSPGSISASYFTLGALTVYTADAKLWKPRPDWERIHDQREDILNPLMSLRLQWSSIQSKHRNDTGIASSQQTLRAMTEITNSQALISSLSIAVANADISSARKLTSQISGLGVGLTPSGDDFLMGAIYAAWIIHPPEVADVLAQEIAETAAPLTTSLSAAWLRSAGKGEAGNLWHEFFDALLSAHTSQIQETMKNILAVGETSGADALAGFVGVFKSLMEKIGSKHG
ncbi:MAG: DUF2877 domain-containing protein [Anaerolineales bacterium]